MDIVERLRQAHVGKPEADYYIQNCEAADEIERLREEAQKLKEYYRKRDEHLRDTINDRAKENLANLHEIERLREALEWYASFVDLPPHMNIAPYLLDRGQIARSALQQKETE